MGPVGEVWHAGRQYGTGGRGVACRETVWDRWEGCGMPGDCMGSVGGTMKFTPLCSTELPNAMACSNARKLKIATSCKACGCLDCSITTHCDENCYRICFIVA